MSPCRVISASKWKFNFLYLTLKKLGAFPSHHTTFLSKLSLSSWHGIVNAQVSSFLTTLPIL